MKNIANCACIYLASSLFLAFFLPGSAAAHVTLLQPQAAAGSLYKASFKVGHGCAGSPVKALEVSIPPGVQAAKPMPKAGWTLEITREKLAQPRQEHGKTVLEEVARIRWTAKTPDDYLQNDWYDEFVLQAKLPAHTGLLYWPVSQICAEGRIDWAQVPQPGQAGTQLQSPAPVLQLLPAMAREHAH
jgi:uncharacterized protein YcnI